MQSLFLKGTENTPEFNYDIENFSISISGTSEVEKANPFYQSIIEFIPTIEKANPMRLDLNIKLDSICKNSKRGLLFFLLKLKEVQVHCKSDVRVNWFYPSDNILIKTIGEDMENMVMLTINTIVSKEEETPSLELAESF